MKNSEYLWKSMAKKITTEEDENLQKQTGSLNFYNDNRIDEIMDENE